MKTIHVAELMKNKTIINANEPYRIKGAFRNGKVVIEFVDVFMQDDGHYEWVGTGKTEAISLQELEEDYRLDYEESVHFVS